MVYQHFVINMAWQGMSWHGMAWHGISNGNRCVLRFMGFSAMASHTYTQNSSFRCIFDRFFFTGNCWFLHFIYDSIEYYGCYQKTSYSIHLHYHMDSYTFSLLHNTFKRFAVALPSRYSISISIIFFRCIFRMSFHWIHILLHIDEKARTIYE